MVSIITTLNAAYDITEGRPWWKVRLTAIVLTVGLVVLHPCLSGVGDHRPASSASTRRTRSVSATRSNGPGGCCSGRWCSCWSPPASASSTTSRPDAEQDWVWLTPGSIVATLLWAARVARCSRSTSSYFGNLQRDIRLDRRRHRAAHLVVPLRPGDPARRGVERRDRARLAVWKGRGRTGRGGEASHRYRCREVPPEASGGRVPRGASAS